MDRHSTVITAAARRKSVSRMSGESQDGARAHLFAPIQAPRIKSVTQKAVLDFLAEREAYENLIASQPGMKPVTYRSCFPASYLKSLVRAEVFGEDIEDVAQLDDTTLRAKLEELAGRARDVSPSEAMALVKKEIRLNAAENCARLRVMLLSASYLDLCEKRGWKFVENSPKTAIKHIIAVLEPPGLKQKAEDAVEMEIQEIQESDKLNYKKFIRFVAKKALIYEEVQPLYKSRRLIRPTPDIPSGSPKRSGTPTRPPSSNHSKGKGNGSTNTANASSDTVPSPKPAPPCLVPGCNKNHFVRDHVPKIPADKQKELIDAYKKKKAAEKEQARVSSMDSNSKASNKEDSTDTPTNRSETAVITAEVSGFKFACRIDSGADKEIISDTIVDFLGSKVVLLLTRRLPVPREYRSVDG